ncbi:MAG: hypothetical protein Q4E47_01005 [Candidatus Saccharibacteria bacterium]|nr:hypothetical protein [Candidatus Saccharibacteria bacterium]
MNIETVNKYAKRSLSAYNKIGPLRRYYRKKVYKISEQYADFDLEDKEICTSADYVNTEPWPFSDPNFCPWLEDDNPKHYTLFPDPAGFVNGYATSYVSFKFYQTTGKWLQKTPISEEMGQLAKEFEVKSQHKFDARNWRSLLTMNGYINRVAKPEPGHRYIGINPHFGEFGLVVWYEDDAQLVANSSIVTTKYNRDFKAIAVLNEDYIWIKID